MGGSTQRILFVLLVGLPPHPGQTPAATARTRARSAAVECRGAGLWSQRFARLVGSWRSHISRERRSPWSWPRGLGGWRAADRVEEMIVAARRAFWRQEKSLLSRYLPLKLRWTRWKQRVAWVLASIRRMVLDLEPEHCTAQRVQTASSPSTKPTGILGGVACFIHAPKPRMGTTDCGSSVGPQNLGPVQQGLAWMGGASPGDFRGQGHCVARGKAVVTARKRPRELCAHPDTSRAETPLADQHKGSNTFWWRGIEWWTVQGAHPVHLHTPSPRPSYLTCIPYVAMTPDLGPQQPLARDKHRLVCPC